METLKATDTPVEDILKVAYEGQPETSRQYQEGFEKSFNSLPVMTNENVDETLPVTMKVMAELSKTLQNNINGYTPFPKIAYLPLPGKFERTIIGMERPEELAEFGTEPDTKKIYKEGKEIVIAKWGQGFASPVHGHSTGYMHEEVLKGKIKVNTYRIIDLDNKVVVPYKTEIIGPGVFVSGYVPHDITYKHKRQTLIHNFEAIEPSISLHYLPEHTRDGRDNGFAVVNFSDMNDIEDKDITRITSQQGMYLKPGDVLLVRSTNVPEYGDHFVVVTGPPVMKEHGLRIQDISIPAGKKDTALLDRFPLQTGLTLLKLMPDMRDEFLHFHGIEVVNNEVLFPKA